MLDGILGRGFSSKCKSLLKQARSRIDVIRRKRKATLKFLRKDMADLLVNGLDINAYGRADGLMAEIMLSECYQYVDYSCEFVLIHLPAMEKINHCPEDFREVVSSLMFAAARFSDLPELRDLRKIFYEKYGNSLELFVNKQFVENLSFKNVSLEKKMQLMENIASEFSINWDSDSYKKKMSNPPPVCSEESSKTNVEKLTLKPASEFDEGNSELLSSDKTQTHFGLDDEKLNPLEIRETFGRYGRSLSDTETKRLENHDLKIKDSFCSDTSLQINLRNRLKESERRVHKEQKSGDSYRCGLPPPYTKPNSQPKVEQNSCLRDKDWVRNRGLSNRRESDYSCREDSSVTPPRRLDDRSSKEQGDAYYGKIGGEFDSSTSVSPLRSYRSRRRQAKDRTGDRNGRKVRGNRREETKDDDGRTNDEEEKMIDKLLLHYSKKLSEPAMLLRQLVDTTTEDETGRVPPSGSGKTLTRAATFGGASTARHVHPKLPDYEDLAVRFAALKGR